MFGKNNLFGITYTANEQTEDIRKGWSLIVNSIWHTIQGEGPDAGMPAVFIRLTGCNLRCWFCDTEFDSGKLISVREIVGKVQELGGANTKLVVITGGEPMRQQITTLCNDLNELGYYINIETAGTVWPPGLERLIDESNIRIICSPKTGNVHSNIKAFCVDYKYVIRAGETDEHDGLPTHCTQYPDQARVSKVYRPDGLMHQIWVQPCDEYVTDAFGKKENEHGLRDGFAVRDNLKACVEIALRHGYRISLQQHKILGVE